MPRTILLATLCTWPPKSITCFHYPACFMTPDCQDHHWSKGRGRRVSRTKCTHGKGAWQSREKWRQAASRGGRREFLHAWALCNATLGSFSLFFCSTGKGKKCWKHEAEQSLSGAEEDESQVRVFGRHWGMRPLNDLRHEDHQELPCHVYSTTYCDKSLLFGNFMAPIYH